MSLFAPLGQFGRRKATEPGKPIGAFTVPVNGVFVLPPLPYSYSALEPHIDTLTMQLHHDRHHATYVTELNAALAPYPELRDRSVADLLFNLKTLPAEIQTSVRNNGGGHVNHSIFWAIMGPNAGGEPQGELAQAINSTFGSFANLKAAMIDAGRKRFGSGWSWLVLNPNQTLQVISTPNQDSPYMDGSTPLAGIDVWEHSYYLKYQNKRVDYLNAWFNVVNWDAVAQRYLGARSK